MANPPQNIRALQDQRQLEITWEPGDVCRLPYKTVRGDCPCASCIEEWTGRRLLDPATIPEDIRPASMSFTGNYAIKIAWSDGHNTGLYTWDHLWEICRRNPGAGREA